jgi:ADP-heptose:LPS heptosyltransferase
MRFGRNGIRCTRSYRTIHPPFLSAGPMPFSALHRGPIKQWPNQNFAAVGRALVAAGLAVVLVGDQTMLADCAEIARLIGTQDVFNLAGNIPLEKLPNVLTGARLFVGNDSGPGHMAAALDIPTIVIFSRTPNIDIWHPRGNKAIAIKANVACSPCHHARIDACSYKRRCLTEIKPAYVIEKAMELYRADAKQGGT